MGFMKKKKKRREKNELWEEIYIEFEEKN